jgi:plasmid stabilization system protein ParE
MRLRFHPAARRELAGAIIWYEDDYPGRGVRFRHAIERELERVLAAPESFPKWRGHRRARCAVLARFPYTLVFVIEPGAVILHAVAHDKQRPGYWTRRLKDHVA